MSRFRRRLMALSAIRKAFRDDYIDCDWIENTSTAYIDTLYVPNANTEIEFDFQYTETLDGNKYIGCISKAVDDRYRRWHLLAAPTTIGLWRNTQNQTSSIDFDLNKHIYRLGGNYTEIDGIRTEATVYNYIAVNHFGLFARIGNPTLVEETNDYYSTPSLGKMTYCKIWQSDTLVRDFIPMYQISTDTYGLWDRVEKKFYTSPNGVKFTGSLHFVNDDIRQMMVSLYGNTTADSITYAQMQTGIPTDNILIFCKKNLEWVNVPTSFDRNTKIYGIRTTATEKQADCTIRFYYNGTTSSLGLYVWYKRWGYANGSTSGYNEIQEVWKSYGGYWNTFGKDSYSTPRGVKYFSFWTVNGYRPAQYSASMVKALVVVEE